jgi:hypothetical protein
MTSPDHSDGPATAQAAVEQRRSGGAKPSWPALLGLILLSMAVRGFLIADDLCLSRDGVHFVTFARQLADEPVRWMKATTKQPGYAFLLLGAHRLLGPTLGGDTPESWQHCGQLLALMGGVVVCVATYLLTLHLFGQPAAIVAGVFAGLWPQGAHLSADVLSDMPHLALYLIALPAICGALRRPRLWKPALCGCILGLAYLIRQEALGLVGASVVCWLWPGVHGPWRLKLTSVIILLVGFAAVVAPYSITTGKLMPNKGPADLIEQWPSAAPAPVGPAAVLAHVVPTWLLPGRMAEEWGRSGRYVFSTLFLIGLFLKRRDGRRLMPRADPCGRRLVILAASAQLILVVLRVGVFGEISSRYMVIPAALVIPWAAAAFVAVVGMLASRIMDPTPTRRAAVWVSGYIVVLAPLIYYVCLPVNDGTQRYRAAGIWLRQHAGGEQAVLAHDRLEQIMFYAGRTYPQTTWRKCRDSASAAELQEIIARDRPSWFVDAEASHQNLHDEAQHFKALLGGKATGDPPVHLVGPMGLRVMVFRIADVAPNQDME